MSAAEQRALVAGPRRARRGVRGFMRDSAVALLFGVPIISVTARLLAADHQAAEPQLQPYIVEWVYKVKWGHADEFFELFKKYQLPTLDREKQLGSVLRYTIYHPGLHTSEDQRWDYRVVIEYRDVLAPLRSPQIERELFPDREAFKRGEQQRWELVEAHWDLPIRVVDPHAPEN
jgi:hypothetical protein